jgi:hypothetical protein
MKDSRLPWLNSETGPNVWFPTTPRSTPAWFTGHVSTDRKPWEAVKRIGYSIRLSSHTRTAALFHQ